MSSSHAAQVEVLQRENATLRQQVEKQRNDRYLQVGINLFIRSVLDKAAISEQDMADKFDALDYSVLLFVNEITTLWAQDPSHRDRVIRAMNTPGEAQAFRVALTQNSALRELATQPYSADSDVLRVCIWQFLIAHIFSYEGTRNFYSSTGQNAAYYIKNIDEIDHLMRSENELETGKDNYARRMWRKQAIDAIFRTGSTYGLDGAPFPREDHPWLASTRQENINKLVSQILQIFDVFLGDLARRSDMVHEIVAQAVHLNECFMHQAEFAWKVELDTMGNSNDAFYDNLDKVALTAVNTDTGSRTLLRNEAMEGMSQQDIRSRLYNVCAIKPALTHQGYSASQDWETKIGPVLTTVKPIMTVGWTINRTNVKRPENPSMFYQMAENLGLAPRLL